MMAHDLHSGPVPLGEGYSIEFHFHGLRMDVEWLPRLPKPKQGRRLLPAYRKARNAFLLKIAEATGQRIACVDL